MDDLREVEFVRSEGSVGWGVSKCFHQLGWFGYDCVTVSTSAVVEYGKTPGRMFVHLFFSLFLMLPFLYLRIEVTGRSSFNIDFYSALSLCALQIFSTLRSLLSFSLTSPDWCSRNASAHPTHTSKHRFLSD